MKPLFISRNGQQFGPYSIAEAQDHVRTGNITVTDWAWQEGMPNWIPLNQVPGFGSALPPAPPIPAATPVAYDAYKAPAPKDERSFLKKLGTGIVALAYAAFKFKFLLFGALKTGLSMLLMIWAYSTMYGWWFAAGLVFLIFVHEMGHVIAAKWLGLPVTAPLFIPFVGAFILLKQNPRDAWTEALVGYGGPLAGCIGSWICWFIALQMNSDWIMAVASISFLLNLFNMIPVPPLDGGRICSAVSPWFWIIGLVLFGASVFYFHRWSSLVLLIIILFFALPRMKQTLFSKPTPEMQAYYNTHISNRITMALLYLGLIAALLLGYWDSSAHLSHVAYHS